MRQGRQDKRELSSCLQGRRRADGEQGNDGKDRRQRQDIARLDAQTVGGVTGPPTMPFQAMSIRNPYCASGSPVTARRPW
jgi:hypothetical protein